MFILKNKNRSGTISIKTARKKGRKHSIIKTVGVAKSHGEGNVQLANTIIEKLKGSQSLFIERDDLLLESF